MSIRLERSGSDSGVLALTEQGRRSAIHGLLDLSDFHNESRSHQAKNLIAAYGALQRREGPLHRADLRPYFVKAGSTAVDQRLFADQRRWFDEIGGGSTREAPGRRVDGRRPPVQWD